MLDTRFARFAGDIGDPASHAGGALFERVPQATAARVVGGIASLSDPAERADAVAPFVAAGRRLVARGASAITTSCGFLVAYQAELAAALPVPVMTSALCLLPEVAAGQVEGAQLGILTFDAASLGAMHLRAAGHSGRCVIEGLAPGCGFRRAVLEDAAEDGLAAREADVLDAARRLKARAPRLGVVVLECTNFPPHRAAVSACTGVGVVDVWDVVRRLREESGRRDPLQAATPR